MGVRDHVALRDICWFKTGGVADYYIEVDDLQQFIKVIEAAHKEEMPYRVIGEGSNVLISDSGFPGLIIKNKTKGILFIHDKSQVIVESGITLRELVSRALSWNYSGLEFLGELPGTVGGAVYSNRGLFGHSIGEYIKSATLYFPKEKDPVRQVGREWFEFDAGSSRIKRMRNHKDEAIPTILSVTFQLSKMTHEACLKRNNYFKTLAREFPVPLGLSMQVFDNLSSSFTKSDAKMQEKIYGRKPIFILDRTQIKKMKVNDIFLYPTNPNFFINAGLGTSSDTATLITQIKEQAQNNSFTLEERIEYLGVWD